MEKYRYEFGNRALNNKQELEDFLMKFIPFAYILISTMACDQPKTSPPPPTNGLEANSIDQYSQQNSSSGLETENQAGQDSSTEENDAGNANSEKKEETPKKDQPKPSSKPLIAYITDGTGRDYGASYKGDRQISIRVVNGGPDLRYCHQSPVSQLNCTDGKDVRFNQLKDIKNYRPYQSERDDFGISFTGGKWVHDTVNIDQWEFKTEFVDREWLGTGGMHYLYFYSPSQGSYVSVEIFFLDEN
jgi:hypothetical protein